MYLITSLKLHWIACGVAMAEQAEKFLLSNPKVML